MPLIQKEAASRVSFPTLFVMFSLLLIFGCFLTPYFAGRAGHDQSSYLFEAQRFLFGFELYGPHLSETNPPIIVWFSAIPVLFARWTQGSPTFFLRLVVVALIFVSVAWSARILRHSGTMGSLPSSGLVVCAVLAIEFAIGPYNFGQREHLLVIFLLPYLLAVATGAIYHLSLVERCALGVAAGIAIWFKPHDALILVGLELFLSLRARDLRRALTPEFLSLVLTSSLVLLLIFVITPLYWKVTVPLLFDTYWALGKVNAFKLALSFPGYWLQILLAFLACVFLNRSLRNRGTAVALLVCSVAAFFAFAIQHNDWWYHAYPHQALLLLAEAYLVVDFLYPVVNRYSSDLPLLKRSMIVASGLAVLLLCAIAIFHRTLFTVGTHAQHNALDEVLAQYKPSTTVYVFSDSVAPLSFAYNHDLIWGSRFAHLWMLPAIVQNEVGPRDPSAPFKRLSPGTLARLATLQRAQVAEDLDYWKPSVVIFGQFDANNFDMLSWFLQDSQFAAAWSHYQRQANSSYFLIYNRVQ